MPAFDLQLNKARVSFFGRKIEELLVEKYNFKREGALLDSRAFPGNCRYVAQERINLDGLWRTRGSGRADNQRQSCISEIWVRVNGAIKSLMLCSSFHFPYQSR